MIGVNVSTDDVGSLKETMEKEQLPWRSFADVGPAGQGPIASTWDVSVTPTFYVLDHKGVIRGKWVGSPGKKVLDTALENLIRDAEGRSGPP